jgi:hypothetical protein
MKTAYTFVTLRYVHDVVTGEFANVGVVLYAPAERYLEARFTSSYERLNALFVKIDQANYRNLIRYLGNRFVELATEVRDGLDLVPVQGIDQIVRRVLPPDDSSLQWSATSGGFSSNLGETVGQLYARMVERYTRSDDASIRACHLLERIPAQKELVRENELESFAESVATEIASHSDDNP